MGYCSKDKNGIKLRTHLILMDMVTILGDKVVTSTAAVSEKKAVIYLGDDKDLSRKIATLSSYSFYWQKNKRFQKERVTW